MTINTTNMGYKYTECMMIIVPESEAEQVRTGMYLGGYDSDEIDEKFEKCLIEHLEQEAYHIHKGTCMCIYRNQYYVIDNGHFVERKYLTA